MAWIKCINYFLFRLKLSWIRLESFYAHSNKYFKYHKNILKIISYIVLLNDHLKWVNKGTCQCAKKAKKSYFNRFKGHEIPWKSTHHNGHHKYCLICRDSLLILNKTWIYFLKKKINLSLYSGFWLIQDRFWIQMNESCTIHSGHPTR